MVRGTSRYIPVNEHCHQLFRLIGITNTGIANSHSRKGTIVYEYVQYILTVDFLIN